jgi:Holliday junction resolvase RusA-like endonuclease
VIRFIVPGEPVAQGSMVPFLVPGMRQPSMHASNAKELNRWRKAVALAATAAAEGRVAAPGQPVIVRATFRFPPPAKMPKDRVAMTVAPDADKLLRACLDAMTLAEDRKGNRLGVYADDKQVVDVRAIKLYATPLNPPGAYIEVDFPEPML